MWFRGITVGDQGRFEKKEHGIHADAFDRELNAMIGGHYYYYYIENHTWICWYVISLGELDEVAFSWLANEVC